MGAKERSGENAERPRGAVARVLDGLDAAWAFVARRLSALAFRGGETPARRAGRALRRAAARWAARWGEPFFRPDETVAPDPLRPSARIVAAGIAQAFERGAAQKPDGFRLLVCRAPGRTIEIRLDAARRRCIAEVRPPAPGAPARAEAALPPLAPGDAPSRFEIGADNLRLVLRRTPAGVSVGGLRGRGALC